MVFLTVVLIWSQVLMAAEPLDLSKTDGIDEGECALTGEDVTYTICYGNLLKPEVGLVNLIDMLPEKVDFISAEVEEITEICPVAVSVDIKPGGCPTPVNVGSKGVLPVAVLGTGELDVQSIDPTTITLAGVAPLRWSYEDVGTPYAIDYEGCDIMDCHELEGDGIADLTLKFDTPEIAEALGDVYDRKCVIVELTGTLKDGYGGLPFSGGDVVKILEKKRPPIVPSNSLLLNKP